MNCPKCGVDISDTYEPDDYSCGIVGGWYCEACDLGSAIGVPISFSAGTGKTSPSIGSHGYSCSPMPGILPHSEVVGRD